MLRYLSLTALNQLLFIAQHLLLLPIYLRAWGQETTAVWLSAMAAAGVLALADLGLRTAMFAAIADGALKDRLASLWSLIRVHIVGVGLLAIAGATAWLGPKAPEWAYVFVPLLVIAAIVDTIASCWVTMQEARGEIVRADTLWILVGFLRLALTIAIVVGFSGPPTAVALAMVCASVIGLLAQKQSPAVKELGPLFTRWRFTGWGSHYRDARWTASTPVQNFAQTSLPVLALSLFASAALIPTFVALRALFGFARLAIQNLGRFLSARYVLAARADDREEATVRLLVMAGVAAWLGLGLCLGIYAENGWITIPWFKMQALEMRPYFMAAFSAAALCAVATIFSLSLGRDGRIKAAGGANYLYAGDRKSVV